MPPESPQEVSSEPLVFQNGKVRLIENLPAERPSSTLSDPTKPPQRVDSLYECNCRPQLLNRLKLIMSNSLMPAFEEFRSCQCSSHQFDSSLVDLALSSGYDTSSMSSHTPVHEICFQFPYPSQSPRARPGSSAYCGCSSSYVTSTPKLVAHPGQERTVAPLSCRLVSSTEKRLQVDREQLCRAEGASFYESNPHVSTWVDRLPDTVALQAFGIPLLRRKRKMSNLCRKNFAKLAWN
ncbi:hypothetical protein LOZ61_000068 [Ophidiomyces ophidiicola]|nr:hypothetical protein LOZ61_000068 [Ophidiomyces ophidiicola]KAI1926520.1 hypothetical protein LOZ64_000286 [Ophidiomyces ophidiicola]KAI1931582.1 hypothetical protein LOZ60_000114 [Ophidiomyces ophidiicola]KAI1969084.1 hypothetical protein LOZ59_000110 [Ophidiomyces ophidiicola]KAI2014918.1 hypothetical protein LOZ49_001006 [Ophidiomyces ophidiicola]